MEEFRPRANRLFVSMHVYVRGEDVNGVPFDVEVDSQNVSRGGVAFHLSHEVEMGSSMEIVVQRPPIAGREFPPLFTTGKVVRIRPSDGGGADIGVEFTGPKLMMFAAETEPV